MIDGHPDSNAERTGQRRGTRWLKIIASVFAVCFFVIAGRQHLGELGRLTDVSPAPVGGMVLFLLVARVFRGAVLKTVLARLGHQVGLGEMFLLTILMTYTNLILPRLGLSTPAVYLKRKNRLSYAHFSSLLLFIVVIYVIVVGSLGLTCLGVVRVTLLEPVDTRITGLFAFVAAVGTVVVSLRVAVPETWRGKIADFLRRSMACWGGLGSRGGLIVRVVVLSAGMLVAQVIKLELAFEAIDVEVNFHGVFVAVLLGELALLVSITPAGLGFREAAVTLSANMLGCSPAVALSAAVLDRIVMTVCVILLAQVGIWRLIAPLGPSDTAHNHDRTPSP